MKPNASIRIKIQNHKIFYYLLTFLFFLVYCLILEFCASNTWFLQFIPYPSPSINSIYPELDVKFQRLMRIENVNCMFFGSSMVDAGIDPVIFEKQFHTIGNPDLKCFNMGLSSSMLEISSVVSTTISEWQPLQLVVFGVSPIDIDKDFTQTRPIAKMPVFSYYNGHPTIEGWLFNHFYLPWFYASLPHLQDNAYKTELSFFDQLLDERGVRITSGIGAIDRGKQDVYFTNYQINSVDMSAFQSAIRKLSNKGIKIVVVEMPVHPAYFPYLVSGGEKEYLKAFQSPMRSFLKNQNIPFITSQNTIEEIVDDTNWANKNHLNRQGAMRFTSYIFQKMSEEGIIP